MSDSAAASALWPTPPGECVPSSKWTPSTTASIDVTVTPCARTTAASSPLERTTRSPRTPSRCRIRRISSSSPIECSSISEASERDPDREHPGAQRHGQPHEPPVPGQRDEGEEPDDVPGDEPRRREEDGERRPGGHPQPRLPAPRAEHGPGDRDRKRGAVGSPDGIAVVQPAAREDRSQELRRLVREAPARAPALVRRE